VCILCCRLCVVVLNIPLIIIATRGYEVGPTLQQLALRSSCASQLKQLGSSTAGQ
jgi:hypothetical protein